MGVTGVRENLSTKIKPTLMRINKFNPKIPIAVGFGISKPEHVRNVIRIGADGAIVGSAFVRIIEEYLNNREKMLHRLEKFAMELKKGTTMT